MSAVPAWVHRRVRRRVVACVSAELSPRRGPFAEATGHFASVGERLPAVEGRVVAALARFDRTPAHGGVTVHAAHARHPGVAALFSRRGLPACTDCAVGADETIAEAAFGEGFDLPDLLTEMNRLFRVS